MNKAYNGMGNLLVYIALVIAIVAIAVLSYSPVGSMILAIVGILLIWLSRVKSYGDSSAHMRVLTKTALILALILSSLVVIRTAGTVTGLIPTKHTLEAYESKTIYYGNTP